MRDENVLIIVAFLLIPLAFTVANTYQLFRKTNKTYVYFIEGFGIPIGLLFLNLVLNIEGIEYVMWYEAIDSFSDYPPFDISRLYQLTILLILGIMGWAFLRFCPISKQPPLLTVIGFAFLYAAFITLIILMIQIAKNDFTYYVMLIFPINILIIIAKLIREQISYRKNQPVKEELFGIKKILSKSYSLPVLGFVALAIFIGLLLMILILFGQSPDELTKIWTNTAEWTFSQQIPPPRLDHTGHYLCTVAATGHRKLVKPIRVGKRNGELIIVNRQLMIANAFEDLIKERTPKFHKAVRNFYDKTGFPISKYINTKFRSDIVYIIMKPLEWVFLTVLYLCDVNPENRIAIQYKS